MFQVAGTSRASPSRQKRRRRKLKESATVGTPPQEPSSLWKEDGFLLCLQVYDLTGDNASFFLRFKIPFDTIDHLIDLSNSDCSEGIHRYVWHSHREDIECDLSRFSDFSLNPDLNGPFPCELRTHGSSAAIGSVVYGLDGGLCNLPPSTPDYNPHCHHIRYCDFSQWSPRWNMTPLPYHQDSPVMVTVNKQLYIFEGRGNGKDGDYTTSEGPLGFVFDPTNECCKELPFSAFHSVGVFNLMVAVLGQKLLLLDERTKVQHCYVIKNSTWIPLDIKGLLDHILEFWMQPITVPQHNTIYWIDKRGRIRAFDWVSLKMFTGAVAGFGPECRLRDAYKYSPKLVHLKDELFCLVWCDDYHLHLTIIRVCLSDPLDTLSDSTHDLRAFVVACSCYRMKEGSPPYFIHAAHLLS